MADRFFTFMIVPERSDRVRKFTLPTLYLRAGAIIATVLCLLAVFILFDYLHVLSQVAENKRLRLENHTLKVDVQNAQSKLEALDQSVSRLKTFANKLRVISNLDAPGSQQVLQQVPETEQKGGQPQSHEQEDSGGIAEPEKHGRLESMRQQTLAGELGQNFESEDLVAQIQHITEASIRLRETAELEEQGYAALQEHLQDRVARLLSTPSILPATGWISSEYGTRFNPFSGVRTYHAGLDVANRPGTRIVATADGTVTHTGTMGGFGLVVRIDHGYNIVTKFGHNQRILVKPGQRVRRGDVIAEMGSSGRSTGPHCHYQVEVGGKPVNPRLFILETNF